jgi:hypothetical protein
MNLLKYNLTTGEAVNTFNFVSEGKNGNITKLIIFTEAEVKDFFYLGFGDFDEKTGEIDDEAISNNGDRDKILATVANAVIEFTDNYPNAVIYATGSTDSRTRLYQIGITILLKEATNIFRIFGDINGEWEEFIPNKRYQGFVEKKNSIFAIWS